MQEKIQKLKNLTLLFVEDEEDLLEIISDTFIKLEANFRVAKNGKEALEVLANNKIDILVTDINMPVMNGLDLIKNVKENYPNMPIIVMTAHTEAEYIQKAKDLGVEEYLIKPFDFIKFIELVTEVGK